MLKGTHYKELPSAYLNRQFIEGLAQCNDAQTNANGEQNKKNFFTNQQSEYVSQQMKNQELQNKQEISQKDLENVKCFEKEDEQDSSASAVAWMRSLLSSTYNEAVESVLSEKCREVQNTAQKGQFDSKLLDIHILRCQLQLNTETKENDRAFQQEEAATRQIRRQNSQNDKHNNNKSKPLDDKIPKPASASSSYAEQSKLKKLFYLTHNQNHNNHNSTLPLSQTLAGYPKTTSLTRCRKNSISNGKESSMLNTKRMSPQKSKEKKNNNRSTSFVKQNRNNLQYPSIQDTNNSYRLDNNNNNNNNSTFQSLQPNNTSFRQNTSQPQNRFDGCHNNQQDLNHSQNEFRTAMCNTKPKDICTLAYVSQDMNNTASGIQNCSKSFESIDTSQNTTNPYNTTNTSFYQSLLNSQQQKKPARKVSPYQQQPNQQNEQGDSHTFNYEDFPNDSPQQHPRKNGYLQDSIQASSLAIQQQKQTLVLENNKLEISHVMEGCQPINSTFLINQKSNPHQQRDIYQQSYLSCASNNASTSVGSAQETKLNSAQQIPKRHMRSFSRQ